VCRWRVALGLELMRIGVRLRPWCPGRIGAGNGVWLRAVGCVWAVVVLWIAGTGTAAASRWAIQSVPENWGGFGAVSCTSDSACITIGAVAAGWNGRQWSKLPRSPAGDGLSCTSRMACIAVGSCYCSFVHTPVAARWNGREWSIQRTPHRAGELRWETLVDPASAHRSRSTNARSASLSCGENGSGAVYAVRLLSTLSTWSTPLSRMKSVAA
jgi:hypothetical protein